MAYVLERLEIGALGLGPGGGRSAVALELVAVAEDACRMLRWIRKRQFEQILRSKGVGS